jgi:hypothetical protein
MALRTIIEPASVGINRQKLVFETLQHLIPFDLPRVLVDRLNASQPIMSFGVGPSVQFQAMYQHKLFREGPPGFANQPLPHSRKT